MNQSVAAWTFIFLLVRNLLAARNVKNSTPDLISHSRFSGRGSVRRRLPPQKTPAVCLDACGCGVPSVIVEFKGPARCQPSTCFHFEVAATLLVVSDRHLFMWLTLGRYAWDIVSRTTGILRQVLCSRFATSPVKFTQRRTRLSGCQKKIVHVGRWQKIEQIEYTKNTPSKEETTRITKISDKHYNITGRLSEVIRVIIRGEAQERWLLGLHEETVIKRCALHSGWWCLLSLLSSV